jgi:hypothetical protein
MRGDKLEPRLEQEISAARATGLGDRAIPVLIEHAEVIPAPHADPRDWMADLAARVRHLQRGIVEQLREFGAPDIQQSVVANLIGASLPPEQIEAVAAREDVKVIRLNGEERAVG